MTIKDVHAATGQNTRFFVSWNGSTSELDRNDEITLHAFGGYAVQKIVAVTSDVIEIEIKAIPAAE